MSKLVSFLSVIMLLVLITSFGVLIFNILTYTMPTYSIQTLEDNQTLVYTDEYLGKVNTLTILEIMALLILSVSIFYAGLLNYLKAEKSENNNSFPRVK